MVAILFTLISMVLFWLYVCLYDVNQYSVWDSYTNMYDCDYTKDKGSVLYLPRHETLETGSFEIVTKSGKVIDFRKYMNWCRCLNVTRAAHLIGLLGDEWYTFYVRWDNSTTQTTVLNTIISALALKPEFLSAKPCNIWCRFRGGPPNKQSLIESSLLNFIVDRVLMSLIEHNEAHVDALIIKALHYQETLFLEGPK